MNRSMLPLVVGSLLLLVGCGGGGDNSTGPEDMDDEPTDPVTLVSFVVVCVCGPGSTTAGTAVVGDSGSHEVRGTYSNGDERVFNMTEYSETVWTTSDAAVMTIVAATTGGNGVAVGVGQAAICATYGGMTACFQMTITDPTI